MNRSSRRKTLWAAGWRETAILLREFRRPLLVFLAALLGLGGLYFYLSRQMGEGPESYTAAVYLMLTLAFLQPSGEFPASPVLQIFFFVLPGNQISRGQAHLLHSLAGFDNPFR